MGGEEPGDVRMIGYVQFHMYLVLLISSVIIFVMDVWRKNYETIGPVLFFLLKRTRAKCREIGARMRELKKGEKR